MIDKTSSNFVRPIDRFLPVKDDMTRTGILHSGTLSPRMTQIENEYNFDVLDESIYDTIEIDPVEFEEAENAPEYCTVEPVPNASVPEGLQKFEEPVPTLNLKNLSVDSVKNWFENLPAEWKKYGLIIGGTLLARRILFK